MLPRSMLLMATLLPLLLLLRQPRKKCSLNLLQMLCPLSVLCCALLPSSSRDHLVPLAHMIAALFQP